MKAMSLMKTHPLSGHNLIKVSSTVHIVTQNSLELFQWKLIKLFLCSHFRIKEQVIIIIKYIL